MAESIRSFDHPVLFCAHASQPYIRLITIHSGVGLRKLAWKVRQHRGMARRAFGLELIVPCRAKAEAN